MICVIHRSVEYVADSTVLSFLSMIPSILRSSGGDSSNRMREHVIFLSNWAVSELAGGCIDSEYYSMVEWMMYCVVLRV